MKKVLHVGCGQETIKNSTKIFETDEWQETRLDIDETLDPPPHILADIRDLSQIPDCSFDAVYSSHNLEHLFAHEVEPTLKGFNRILKDDGEVFIACPDLEGIANHIVNGNLTEPIYHSPAGPIAPIDILYGHRPALKAGRHYMAHNCGFTINVLLGILKTCGFHSGAGAKDGISIWVNAIKPPDKLKEIESRFRLHMGAEVD